MAGKEAITFTFAEGSHDFWASFLVFSQTFLLFLYFNQNIYLWGSSFLLIITSCWQIPKQVVYLLICTDLFLELVTGLVIHQLICFIKFSNRAKDHKISLPSVTVDQYLTLTSSPLLLLSAKECLDWHIWLDGGHIIHNWASLSLCLSPNIIWNDPLSFKIWKETCLNSSTLQKS